MILCRSLHKQKSFPCLCDSPLTDVERFHSEGAASTEMAGSAKTFRNSGAFRMHIDNTPDGRTIMMKTAFVMSSVIIFAIAGSVFGVVIPPVHIGEANPEAEGFTGDGLPISGTSTGGARRIIFKGVQRYKVDLDTMPSAWTMTARGSVNYVKTHGLGIVVSIARDMAVCLQWSDSAQISDLETSVGLDATQVHTYQIVWNGETASLWIDGVRSIERMAIRRADSIGADTLAGFWIGSFSSRGASESAWDLWKFDEGNHVVSKPAEPNTPGDKTIEIGSRLELFVDDWLVDRMSESLNLQLHAPRPAKEVFVFDKPWEGSMGGYVSILRDGDRYRMYYRGGLGTPDHPDVCICYAESRDGLHWTKPELNLFEYAGSKKNNIIWMGTGSHCALGVFRDANPKSKPSQRYKAVSSDGYNKPVYAFGSPDGIHWELMDQHPVINEKHGAVAAYDSHFTAWWDDARQRYVMYHRAWYRPVDGKVRSIAVRTSADFINWTPLELLDFGEAPFEHLYTNAAQRYFRAPHIVMLFPKRFLPDRKSLDEAPLDGISDAVFASSRDGVRFDRRFMEAFIRPGRESLNWYSRSNMVATGLLPTTANEISLYVSQAYRHPTAHLRRHVLRTDGFVSVNASYAGGQLITKPIVFSGRRLVINYATSAAGSLRIEIQNAAGEVLPGFALAECPEMFGDKIEEIVSWQDSSDLSSLAGIPVRLRFVMKDADLFSIRFKN